MFADDLHIWGKQIAVISEESGAISYDELVERSDSIVKKVISGNIKPLLAIECNNSLETLLAYIGALRAACPVLLISADLDRELRNFLLNRYQFSWIFLGNGKWLNLNTRSPSVHPDLSLMLSTSGSTGTPKLVRLSRSNLQANARSIAKYLHLDLNERPITVLPMHYSYGLSVINSHLAVGATILLTNASITTAKFWDFFNQKSATSFSGVPTTYELLKKIKFDQMQLPTMRTMTQAGGRLSVELTKWFHDINIKRERKFFIMYGQTEATARMAYVPPHMLEKKMGSIGIAIPGGKLGLITDSGAPVIKAGNVGEICYSGDNVMMGYANSIEDLSLGNKLNGFLMTGDLGYMDSDGYFYVVGRKKRFVKVFGNRVSLEDVENHLCQQGFQAAVIGRDDLIFVALIGDTTDRNKLVDYMKSKYKFHHSAFRVELVENFPRTDSGKIRYTKLSSAFRI